MAIIHYLEKPIGNVYEHGVIQIEGWAFSTTGDIRSIEIKRGMKTHKASFGLKREDVGAAHPGFFDRSVMSGYRAEITLNEKQRTRRQRILIKIIAENESTTIERCLEPSVGQAEGVFTGLRFALQKSKQYLRMHRFPRSIAELKVCMRKFWTISTAKPAKIGGLAQLKEANPYLFWQYKHHIGEKRKQQLMQECANYKYRPLISIIMPSYQPDEELFCKAIESVKCQIYPDWELIINDDCSPCGSLEHIVKRYADGDERIRFHRMDQNSNISLATNAAAEMANGEFLFFMDHDDTIECHALSMVVRALNHDPSLDIIYSDDDKISMTDERCAPQFKPDYSPELLLSYMYFSHIFVLRKSLFDKVGGCRIGYEGAQDYDLALRVTELTDRVYHIPEVLYHWRIAPTSTAKSADKKPASIPRGQKAVEDAVIRRGIPAKVAQPEFAANAHIGIYSLSYAGNAFPLVSIIIPTKNHTDVLKRCLESIQKKTTYPNYEIILVDNCSTDADTLAYYKELSCKIVECPNVNGSFNFSRMVNTGVEHSNGEYIVLLNNDTEVISGSWLEDFVLYMQIEGVGIVGSKLLYPDGSVQHAGVVLKMLNGVAGHAFKLIPDWDGGYMSFANCTRNYSAVTAACFMTSRSIYQSVEGFDEENFGISFNDVDFCLRVRAAGYRIVYNPSVRFYHHEGKSRGVEQSGYYSDAREELNLLQRWKLDAWFHDPYYNENLSLENERFEVNCDRTVPSLWNKLNVLLITHNLNYEGAPLMQFHIADGLKNKYDFSVLSPKEGPLRQKYEAAGIPVYVGFDGLLAENDLAAYKHQLKAMCEQLEKRSFDLIYTNTIETFWGVDLGNSLDIPVIWGIHESVNFVEYYAQRFCTEIANLAMAQFPIATKVAFVAKATQALYEKTHMLNFAVIKNGLDLEPVERYRSAYDKQTLRKANGISPDKTVVSIFGAVCFRKGQKVFIEAASQLLKDQNRNLHFCIVGAKESPYLDDIRRYIDQNNMHADVSIIPVCDDIYQYYMMSDYFVCASYEESSPQVILEAMAFELPIVSTNVFGIPELIRHGNEAILVDPGDPDALAQGLRRCMDDTDFAKQLACSGKQRLKAYFTRETMLTNYDYLFQEAYEECENHKYLVDQIQEGGHTEK